MVLRVGAHVDGVVIEVHPVAVVAGKIAIEGIEGIEGSGGCPEGEGSVMLERRGSREYAFGRTILDGDVLIEGVVPGSFAVRVQCTGYVSAATYPDLLVGGTDVEDVVWTVKPGTKLTGRVTTKSGMPVGEAQVTVNAGLGLGARVSTATDGTFTATGLPVGEVIVEAAAVGYTSSEEVKATTSLTTATRVELVLADKTGSIVGTVIDHSGRPVADQRVEVRTGEVTAGPNANTDVRGEFTVTGLDAGSYSVVVESKWQDASSRSRLSGPPVKATVTRAGTTRVQLQVDGDSSRITGTVVDSRGSPIADVAIEVALFAPDVEARRRDWEPTQAWSSATGTFEVTGLPDHAFAVRARIEGANEVVVDNVQPARNWSVGRPLQLRLPDRAGRRDARDSRQCIGIGIDGDDARAGGRVLRSDPRL